MDIYKNIYETVNDNLEKSGMHFPFSEEQYLNIVRSNPYIVKMSELSMINSDSDMDAFFYRVLNRLCDDGTKEHIWQICNNLGMNDGDDMLMVVATEVSKYDELRVKNKRIIWDIKANKQHLLCEQIKRKQKEEKRKLFLARLRLVKERIKLYTIIRLWDSFSDESKNRIRRLFGRGEK